MNQQKAHRKERIGKVVSNKAQKTLIVAIERKVKHAVYGKIIRKTTRVAVHDEKQQAQLNDKVQIQETRPLSKTKRWRLIKILEKTKQL